MALSTDYIRSGLSSLTFNESGTLDILVSIVNDIFIEETESFTILLSNPQPEDVLFKPDNITITIIDDDEREFYDFLYQISIKYVATFVLICMLSFY